MPVVESSVDAIGKAIFHATKFPTQPVFGLLVGKRLQQTNVFVVDAVPIAHTLPAVCPHPIIEAAVAMVASYVKTQGLVVLGLYAANERLNDNSISPYTTTVVRHLLASEKVSAGGAGLVLWQLQNDKLRASTLFEGRAPIVQHLYATNSADAATEAPLQFAQWDGSTCTTNSVDEARVLTAVKDGVTSFENFKLIDFEDHLENVALDFFNEKNVKFTL